MLVGGQRDSDSRAYPTASRANLHTHTPKCLANHVRGDKVAVTDYVKREPITIEIGRLDDVLVAELRTCRAPRGTVALEMREHRGSVHLETTDKLGYGVPSRVCGDQLLDIGASEPNLGLAITARRQRRALRIETSSAPQITNSLVTDLNEVCRGV